jgi:hypothetical protein
MIKDPISDRLYAKIEKQKEKGLSNYGKLLSEANLSPVELIKHAIEENIDILFYLESFLCTLEEKEKND